LRVRKLRALADVELQKQISELEKEIKELEKRISNPKSYIASTLDDFLKLCKVD
jgi:DNA gyrase/topoisomerase IV subunit A